MECAKKIETIRDEINNLIELYDINRKQLEENEAITQDILHQIELGSYVEGRKWYGQLRKTRKARRLNKDVIEVLVRFNDLFASQLGKTFLNELNEILGEARKRERSQHNRHYAAKQIKNLPISLTDKQFTFPSCYTIIKVGGEYYGIQS